MSSSCEGLLAALKACLLHSDCVQKQGNLPSTCLREHADQLPEECRSLRKATFECKRGMVCSAFFFVGRILTFSCSWICGSGFAVIILACRPLLWRRKKSRPSNLRIVALTHPLANSEFAPLLASSYCGKLHADPTGRA
jgi:cytochrome c oxidase assembly factor 5